MLVGFSMAAVCLRLNRGGPDFDSYQMNRGPSPDHQHEAHFDPHNGHDMLGAEGPEKDGGHHHTNDEAHAMENATVANR